jgi:hypothetical protein
MTTPTTATAAKLAAHLMRKKATLRPHAEGQPAESAGRDKRADAELRQADLHTRA